MPLDTQTAHKIQQYLTQNSLVLFMKGTKRQPRCGFSATVVQILDDLSVDYVDVDILQDSAMREGIKEYGNWPTIPQLYYQGNLIGGCDIIRELNEQGDLARILGVASQPVRTPQLVLNQAAKVKFQQVLKHAAPINCIRLAVKEPGHLYELTIDQNRPADIQAEYEGIPFLFDKSSARQIRHLRIDFVEDANGGGFSVTEEPTSMVGQMTVQELKRRLDAKEPLLLYDVRTQSERNTALIKESVWFDEAAKVTLAALPKDTLVVFQCHHGGRSQAAAEMYAKQGFQNVWNLQGGIDAWSTEIDPSIRKY